MTIVSLIVVGDSQSAPTAPYFTLVGVPSIPGDRVPVTGYSSDANTGAVNRMAFIRRGTDPVVILCNAAMPGTRLGSGEFSGESFAPLRIDPLLRPAPRGAEPRLYIVSMWYSNPTSGVPATAVAGMVTWFNARKAVAASAGVTLACLTNTLPSRSDNILGGDSSTYDTTYQVPFNAIITNPSWQATNGIYVADLTGIAAISAVGASLNVDNFPDGVHWTEACASLAVPVIRDIISQIIEDRS